MMTTADGSTEGLCKSLFASSLVNFYFLGDHALWLDLIPKCFPIYGRKYFAEYAKVCFSAFGDHVKHWMTFNEPQQFSILGHETCFHAPERCSNRKMSAEGNSATEPYLVVHHVLLAHAAAYDVYKRKFKVRNKVFVVLDYHQKKKNEPSTCGWCHFLLIGRKQ